METISPLPTDQLIDKICGNCIHFQQLGRRLEFCKEFQITIVFTDPRAETCIHYVFGLEK